MRGRWKPETLARDSLVASSCRRNDIDRPRPVFFECPFIPSANTCVDLPMWGNCPPYQSVPKALKKTYSSTWCFMVTFVLSLFLLLVNLESDLSRLTDPAITDCPPTTNKRFSLFTGCCFNINIYVFRIYCKFNYWLKLVVLRMILRCKFSCGPD